MAKRTWEPQGYPIRDPRDARQQVGRIINPPRAMRLGGKSEMSFWDSEKIQARTNKEAGKGPVSDRGKGGRNPI